jgi:hypothetical protein
MHAPRKLRENCPNAHRFSQDCRDRFWIYLGDEFNNVFEVLCHILEAFCEFSRGKVFLTDEHSQKDLATFEFLASGPGIISAADGSPKPAIYSSTPFLYSTFLSLSPDCLHRFRIVKSSLCPIQIFPNHFHAILDGSFHIDVFVSFFSHKSIFRGRSDVGIEIPIFHLRASFSSV